MIDKKRVWLACLALVVMIAAAYSGVWRCGFVHYDDHIYVVSNDHIQHGLNAKSVAWAFTTTTASNWHPLTWLSHIIDFDLYGLEPRGHHLTSLALHACNSILLLLVLLRMTGAYWRSVFVAALFALHPLRVESVVWVSERKDVLSTFFWMASLWAYVAWVEARRNSTILSPPIHPILPIPPSPHSRLYYAASLACFALGLLAKPMVVTLPFVLLLLDYWPLGRQKEGRKLLREKIPFFVLTIAASIVTFLVQKNTGAVTHDFSFRARLVNALVSYARYLAKMVWPSHLAVLYPHPAHWPVGEALAAGLFLAVITGWVVWRAAKTPWLTVGWFWYLGMLVPTIGLVQVGFQSMADRYTYLPLVGIFIMIAWAAHDLLAARRFGRWILGLLGGAAILICGLLTARQTRYWRDSETLFTHAVQVTEGNYMAWNNLGFVLADQGDYAGAMVDIQKSLDLKPDYDEAHDNLGYALAGQGRFPEAMEQYQSALRINPKLTEAHINLGIVLGRMGPGAEAIQEYQTALAEDPHHPQAHNNYGIALATSGKLDEAIVQFNQAIADKQNYAGAHSNLGNVLAVQGKLAKAAQEYTVCLALEPQDAQARNNFAKVLLLQGQVEEAAAQYRMGLAFRPQNPEAHFGLGYCLAKEGRVAEARAEYEMALQQRPNYPAARQQLDALKK